MNKYREI